MYNTRPRHSSFVVYRRRKTLFSPIPSAAARHISANDALVAECVGVRVGMAGVRPPQALA